MSRIRSVLALVAVLVAAACSETPTDMPDLSVVSVEVRPAGRTLSVGDSMLVVVFPRTADGQVLGGEPVTWASTSPGVASLTPKGIYAILRAVTPGSADITAVVGGKVGAVSVTVIATPLVVSSVQITPSLGALEVGKQFELRPVVRAADSTVIGGRTVAWQTSDPAIMTIAGAVDGSYVTLSAHRVGTVVITATVDGKSASRTIQVTAVSPVQFVGVEPDSLVVETGKDFQMNAAFWDATGKWVEWSSVQWYSSDNSVIEVKSVDGQHALITAHRAGTATITADVSGKTGRAVVRVKDPATVLSVAITGGTFAGHTVWTGQLYPLTAVVYGPGGGELSGHPVAWSVQDPAIASIRADGLVHGLAAGSTMVTAEAGGKKMTARLTVYPMPVNGMELALRPSEDELGYPRVAPIVGTTTWTDVDGTMYAAEKTLVAGTLNIGKGISGWEQRLEVETVVLMGGTQRRVVARDTIVDRGSTTLWDVINSLSQMWLVSDVHQGAQLHGRFAQPGRLIVPQTVGSAPSIDYLYVLK